MKILLRSNEDTTLTDDGKEYKFFKGEIYEATSQSTDRKKWFLYNEDYDQHFYSPKHEFDVVVLHYVKHDYYGEFHLPIIGREDSQYIGLTPTGYVTHFHKDNIEVFNFHMTQYIPSKEIRFR